MNDVPFGFQASDGDDDAPRPDRPGGGSAGGGDQDGGSRGPGGPRGPGQPGDPFANLFGMFGGAGGTPDLGAMFQQLGQLFSWSGGPVNWDLANQSARQVAAQTPDPSVSGTERREVDEAFRLAQTWLDQATDFPATGGSPRTWSRAEWIEGTHAAWRELVEPIAARVADAMGSALPSELAQTAGPLVGMMRQVGVSMWGVQVGQSIGQLSTEVFGSADVGVPLAEGHPVLLPANVRAFSEGLEQPLRDVLLYLALREAAHVRLFGHASWLRAHIVARIEDYGRNINVDTSALESRLHDVDLQRPEALREALEGGLFDVPTTPAQQAALDRLELVLALVEGWVDDVVTEATRDRLPSAAALREMIRRRRASGGPAEQTFATLVGLRLRPRRLREAAAFWAAVRQRRGSSGRDTVWAHPDLMPTAEDLADPDGYLDREALDVSALDAADPAEEPKPDSDDT